MTTKRQTLNFSDADQAELKKYGIEDLSSSNLIYLWREGMSRIQLEDRQFVEELLRVVELYHEKYKEIPLKPSIFAELHKRKRLRYCRHCGVNMPLENGLCSECKIKHNGASIMRLIVDAGKSKNVQND